MSQTHARYALVALLAASVMACAGQAPEATANQPKPSTPAPATATPTDAPTPTEPPKDLSQFDIAPGELGAGFKVSPDDVAAMKSASTGYDVYFSDTKVFAFSRDIPPEVIGIYVGQFLDAAARDRMDKTIDDFTPQDIAPEDTTGGPFMMDGVGDNAAGFTGRSNAAGSMQWHVDALVYRDGDLFVRLGVTYEDGVKPAATTKDIIALIAKHTDPINAAH